VAIRIPEPAEYAAIVDAVARMRRLQEQGKKLQAEIIRPPRDPHSRRRDYLQRRAMETGQARRAAEYEVDEMLRKLGQVY